MNCTYMYQQTEGNIICFVAKYQRTYGAFFDKVSTLPQVTEIVALYSFVTQH